MVATPADLSGLAALVTGCGRARGLGRAIALTLATAGADVAVTDRSPTGVRNTGEPGPSGPDAPDGRYRTGESSAPASSA